MPCCKVLFALYFVLAMSARVGYSIILLLINVSDFNHCYVCVIRLLIIIVIIILNKVETLHIAISHLYKVLKSLSKAT